MALESGRSEIVEDSEILQRAFFSKRTVSREKRRILPNILSPFSHVELSVCRIDDMSDDEKIETAIEVARKRGMPKCYGYLQFPAALPRQKQLDVDAEEPPLHHANIVGWPDDDDRDEKRSKQLAIAKLLVEEVEPILWDEPKPVASD